MMDTKKFAWNLAARDATSLTPALTWFVGRVPGQRAIVVPPAELVPPNLAPETVRRLENGARVFERIRQAGPGLSLSAEEEEDLACVLLVTRRPALLIREGAQEPAPPPWDGILDSERDALRHMMAAVGRVECIDDFGTVIAQGSGFVVGPRLLMTNRHVAERVEARRAEGMTPRVDFLREAGSAARRTASLVRLVLSLDEWDASIYEIAELADDGAPVPPPLALASEPPLPSSRFVCAVGFPKGDSTGDTPLPVIKDLFHGQFGVKRLSPGAWAPGERFVLHDCTTLGGSSGSCVFHLASNRVIGVHFYGEYRNENRAVPVWKLMEDPRITALGLNYF
jgi:hypothetical protein